MFRSLYPPSSLLGVNCLFNRDCIYRTCLNYDPIYNPQREPEKVWPIPIESTAEFVKPTDFDAVRRALLTLIRLNAAPPSNPEATPK